MAIYRTGTASLSATGVIKGVGTNWQDKLSLVRVGATMIFQTAPLTICTISSIVSPTEMRATATDGAVVAAGTKYVILLHDSITVDGLAQDVAETLRYYQSKETVIEDAIEFFQNFDWERIAAVGNQVKADAQTASTAATNAKTSETNAKTSENAAKASQTAAAGSQSAAAASASAAKTSETNAATSRTAADNSATAAAASQNAAKTSETNAKTSETNANSSNVAAAGSATAAANSATAASGYASAAKTSENNAKTSENNANASKTAASGSASAAAGSATTATQQADRAKTEADRAASANPDNQLRKANNLSDVADKAASRNNLDVPGLNNASNTFSGNIVINNQNGITVKPGSGQANVWFVSANSAGVARYRLGIEANEQFKLYAYDSNGAGGRGVFSYDYASNKTTFSSILETNNIVSTTTGFEGGYCELGSRQPNQMSYVDFNYSAKYDFDARIVCDGMDSDQAGGGNLRIYSGYEHHKSIAGIEFEGGSFRVLNSSSEFSNPVTFNNDIVMDNGSFKINGTQTDKTPVGRDLKGVWNGVDSYDFSKACNINLYSFYSIGFCSAFHTNTNGVLDGKPAVMINVRSGDINAKGSVISKGVTLTSDRNAKEEITELDGDYVSDVMDKIATYSYRYKDGSRYTAGVIAQELEIWIPQLVSTNPADGSKQVDYMGLIGYLHSAFKSEKARRKSMEERLKKIESYLAFKFPEDDA